MRHIYIAFYLAIVIRFLRTTIRKMLVPHRNFRNKCKFGLYAVPKGERVTLHFANVYVDDPGDLDSSSLFHDLGVVMSRCHVFAIADENNEQDIIKDMIAIVTSFCCRLYGARRWQNKARLMKAALESREE